uniref:Protein toll n=1 Tax=Cacopsylla melanoneura TaxID=428564 RepID=A0A8D9E1N6_9HEMI
MDSMLIFLIDSSSSKFRSLFLIAMPYLKVIPFSPQVSCLVTNCPSRCYCTFSPFLSQMTVNCSSAGLTRMPRSLPTSYDGKKASKIQLFLSNNSIESLQEVNDDSYALLTELDLSNNSISLVETYSYFNNLKKLDLSRNHIKYLNVSFISFIASSNLSHIGLHYNPLSCSCNISALHSFLVNSPEKFTHLDLVTCKGWTVPLHKVNIQEVCPSYLKALVSISITLIILGVLVGLAMVLYYRYQQGLIAWLMARGVLSRGWGGIKTPDTSSQSNKGADKISMARSTGNGQGKEENCILLPD